MYVCEKPALNLVANYKCIVLTVLAIGMVHRTRQLIGELLLYLLHCTIIVLRPLY
jgi:hypothetical protein